MIRYTFPLVMVTTLFFMWGLAISMLDVLNKHFQDVLQVSKGQSGLVQFAVYGAYFLMALPAGYFMRRFGYKRGILLGLSLYALGAFLFYPAAQAATFGFFLTALFVIGCGLAIIETAANPYVTVLGKPEGAVFRLNLAQSFNGLGVVLGPLIGGLVLFAGDNSSTGLISVQQPYLVIGLIVLALLLVFSFVKLPEITSGEETHTGPMAGAAGPAKKLFQHRHFVNGLLAQFFYIGAQAGVWGFFINYAVEEVPGMNNQSASFYLSAAMVLYTAGRFLGTALLRYVEPAKLLAAYAMIAILSLVLVLLNLGIIAVYALMVNCFCMSIMFPTIFALGLKGLGGETKKAGSYMIMSIVGGALIPPLMGLMADATDISKAFVLPGISFIIVFWYAKWGHRKERSDEARN
ncbi:FHS family L-fucose permease-like MFS transporter [Anseongella ginsenosidimutans]|uniref:FHS family L-fucose permease-like MFS transporter n=1 Tax=Anseongella ginsenosidimutans TaxID=496056 RepID=A0A4R3KY64_9SPHI|nr:sugar MFS transporter [Anseongella ginsenosidimutans]QEC51113.1 sugar MFS transporter [Anseongella ginsenosidimutans]TCS90224.1 FHS family L-fucose permease-like MFS transporter [Anseongella ginsenosidimutans]